MADILWPSSFEPETFEFGLRSNVSLIMSTYTGNIQTAEIPGARWVARIQMPPSYGGARQAEIEAFMTSIRGQANRILLYHLKRPIPRGTLRGTPTIAVLAGQGAQSIGINATPGQTLLPGDMIQVTNASGTQLLQVTSASGSGLITAFITPPLKEGLTAGSPVVWNYPTGRFISMTPEIMVPYGKLGVDPGVPLELVEV